MLHRYTIHILFIKIIWFFMIFCMLFGCSAKQTTNSYALHLGNLQYLQILSNKLNKKPQKEIARICVSFTPFNASRQYEILTFENLLKAASAKTNQNIFTQVGIWQQSWNILLWQKKCLILGV